MYILIMISVGQAALLSHQQWNVMDFLSSQFYRFFVTSHTTELWVKQKLSIIIQIIDVQCLHWQLWKSKYVLYINFWFFFVKTTILGYILPLIFNILFHLISEMPTRKNQTFSHQKHIWIVTNYGEFKSSTALRREFCKYFKYHRVSFLTVTPSPELSTDLWPPVMSLLPSFQILPEPKLSKKTMIQ